MASTWPTDFPRPCFECGYDLRACELSEACPECGTPAAPPPRVEGNLLIVADQTHLPSRCVWTNQPAKDEPNEESLFHMKRMTTIALGLAILIYPLILIPLVAMDVEGRTILIAAGIFYAAWMMAGFFLAKQCRVMYWESPRITRPRTKLQWSILLLFFFIFIAVLFVRLTGIGDPDVWAIGLLPIALVVFIMLSRRDRRLKVKKYENGKFWVAGCGKAFLKSIEAEQKAQTGSESRG